MEKSREKYVIEENLQGVRLDKAITILDKEMSRVGVQRLIDNGNITVNRGKPKGIF